MDVATHSRKNFELLPCVLSFDQNDAWVGGSRSGSGASVALLRHWDGQKLTDHAPSELGNAQITAMAGQASNDIWAIGNLLSESNGQNDYKAMFCLRFNGETWKSVSIPEFGTMATWINGAVAVSATELWITGMSADVGDTQWRYITARYLDGEWSAPSLPDPPLGKGSDLMSISGESSADIWAGGYYLDGAGDELPIVLRWDGVGWSTAYQPAVNASIAAIKEQGGHVWLCGSYQPGVDGYSVHWDGAQWTELPRLSTVPLTGIDGDSIDDIWAIGGGFVASSAVLNWDGNSWRSDGLPQPPATGVNAASIAVSNKSNIWLSGEKGSTSSTGVVMHWDGNQWTVILAPEPETLASYGLRRHRLLESTPSKRSLPSINHALDGGEFIHTHIGQACDPNVCPNDKYCAGMEPLHYCIPLTGSSDHALFQCHHLESDHLS